MLVHWTCVCLILVLHLLHLQAVGTLFPFYLSTVPGIKKFPAWGALTPLPLYGALLMLSICAPLYLQKHGA